MTTKRSVALAVTVFVLAVAAVGLYAWWVSPSYSLRQIASAIDDRDVDRFTKYVDVDQLSAQAVDALSTTTNGLTFAVTQNMRPSLIARFRSALLEGVEAGDLSSRTFAGIPGSIRIRRVARTVRHGKVADLYLVAVVSRHPDEELTLEIQMRDKGTYWQIFRLANFAETTTLLAVLDNRSSLAEHEARLKGDREARERAAAKPPQQIVEVTTSSAVVEPVRELRQVKKIVGYKDRSFQVPGRVAFDRMHRDFHIFGCPSITPEMERVSLRALQVQGIPRNIDCVNRPLPYETRTVQEPVVETAMEWVPKQP